MPFFSDEIHELTLDLLLRWGVSFEDKEALGFFHEKGLAVEGSRVKIPSALVEEAIQSAPKSFLVNGRNPSRAFGVGAGYPQAYGPGAGMASVSDRYGTVREATFPDAEEFWKLAHTSRYCSVSAAGLLYPTDLPPETALHTQLYSALRLSDKPLFGLTQDERYAADSIEMARIASGQKENVCMGVVNSLSPLGWDGKMLGSMRVFAQQRQPLIVAACAMAGSTGHVSLAGTLVSTNAEILAGIVYMQLLSPGTPIIYGNTSGIADMGTLALAIGAPETTLMAAAAADLAHRYGLPVRTGGALCDSAYLDMQAGVESGFNLLNTVCSSADFILQAFGVTRGFLSLSFEKWLIDEEILDRSYRIKRGIEKPSEGLVDEIIEAMEDADGFLGHESTASRFRDEFWAPHLSVRGSANKDITEAAAALRQKRLAEYECPPLPSDAEAALRQFRGIC